MVPGDAAYNYKTGSPTGTFGSTASDTSNSQYDAYGRPSYCINHNGIFYCASKTKSRDVTDGLSKTVALSETIVVSDKSDAHGAYWYGNWGNTTFGTYWPPNTTKPDRCRTVYFTCTDTPVAPRISANGNGIWARSEHPGGVNVAMADSAVRFVSSFVDQTVWRAAGSRNGGEKDALQDGQ